jgi:hypothetical protein
VHIWNYESQQLVKSFEVCELPVRAAVFVPRKNWVITGSDDMQVNVFISRAVHPDWVNPDPDPAFSSIQI